MIDNPASQILVVEKILTESFGWRNGYFSKRGSYVGDLHINLVRCALRRWELVYLLTKLCEQNARGRRELIHKSFNGLGTSQQAMRPMCVMRSFLAIGQTFSTS